MKKKPSNDKEKMERKTSIRLSHKDDLNTYMQIDGEYYKIINPRKIVIKLSPEFSRLKVLRCVD